MTHQEPTREEATRETRRVVDELLRRLGAGDHEGIAELFAEDFDWRLSWPERELEGDVPWIRKRRTREEVATHFCALAEHNAPHEGGTTVERIVVDGHDAVVMGTIRNVMLRTGEPYRAAFALHLTVEHGLVHRYHIYEDSLAVAEAWRGAAFR